MSGAEAYTLAPRFLPLYGGCALYNKIFGKILDSSIWLESDTTRIVWLTLLASMDQDGFCQFAAIGNLAQRAIVSIEAAATAVKILESPDLNSSDPDNEGRRIQRVDGGWMVLNSSKYRDIVTAENARSKTRERVAKFRKKRLCNADVTPGNVPVTPSVSYSEAINPTAEEALPSAETHDIEPQDAGRALAEILGVSGPAFYACRDAIGTVKRRRPDLRYTEIPAFVKAVWEEYKKQPTRAKLSLKSFLNELGPFIESDDWKVQEKPITKAPVNPDFKPATPTPAWAFKRPE